MQINHSQADLELEIDDINDTIIYNGYHSWGSIRPHPHYPLPPDLDPMRYLSISYDSNDDFDTLSENDLDDEYSQNHLMDRWEEPSSDSYNSDDECPICYEILHPNKYYQCNHTVCIECYEKCVVRGHRTCALCRAPER